MVTSSLNYFGIGTVSSYQHDLSSDDLVNGCVASFICIMLLCSCFEVHTVYIYMVPPKSSLGATWGDETIFYKSCNPFYNLVEHKNSLTF